MTICWGESISGPDIVFIGLILEVCMARWLLIPLEPAGPSGFEGCGGMLFLLAIVLGIPGALIYHGCGFDKPSASEIQQQNQQANTNQSQNNSTNHTQHNQYSEKHLDHHPVHRIREADFQQRHHNRFRVSNYTKSSPSSASNSLHTSSYEARSHYQQASPRVQSSSDTSVGDLHSNSDIGTSSSSDDSSKSTSSSSDISGGLH